MAIIIDGKEYDEKKFSIKLRNYIVSRQEIEQSKVRYEVEIEKINVLTNYYNTKISELIEQEKVKPEPVKEK